VQPQGTRLDVERERALVERAPTDPAPFAELYDEYQPRIFAFCVRRVEDRAVAEDLTATTFERALVALRSGTFRNDAFGGWLYRVAGNAVVDHVRRRHRTVPLATPAGDDDGGQGAAGWADPADERAVRAFAAALDRDALARAIGELPAGHRQVVVLRYVDGLEGEALATALGTSRATAAVRLHRALRALRERLDREATDAA
jgi:RNA polymerase sigma-70 factor (ECF subfamily)